MGGYLAFELYRQAPALFRGLALCDTKAGADTDEGKAGREKFAQTALEKGLTWVADEMMPKLLRPAAGSGGREGGPLAHRPEGTPAGVAAAQRGMARRPDSTPTLATIACPTLVVVGEQDGLTPPAEAEKMAKADEGREAREDPRRRAPLEHRGAGGVHEGALGVLRDAAGVRRPTARLTRA